MEGASPPTVEELRAAGILEWLTAHLAPMVTVEQQHGTRSGFADAWAAFGEAFSLREVCAAKATLPESTRRASSAVHALRLPKLALRAFFLKK